MSKLRTSVTVNSLAVGKVMRLTNVSVSFKERGLNSGDVSSALEHVSAVMLAIPGVCVTLMLSVDMIEANRKWIATLEMVAEINSKALASTSTWIGFVHDAKKS